MADDSNYSKREQDHFFTDIKERLEKQDAMLIKILDQALKTNGRVTNSEREIAKLKWWKGAIGWGFGLIVTLVLFTLNYFK